MRGVGSCGACRGLAGGDRMGNASSSAEGGSAGGDGGKRQRDNEEGDVDNLDSKKHRTDPGDEEEHKREEAREKLASMGFSLTAPTEEVLRRHGHKVNHDVIDELLSMQEQDKGQQEDDFMEEEGGSDVVQVSEDEDEELRRALALSAAQAQVCIRTCARVCTSAKEVRVCSWCVCVCVCVCVRARAHQQSACTLTQPCNYFCTVLLGCALAAAGSGECAIHAQTQTHNINTHTHTHTRTHTGSAKCVSTQTQGAKSRHKSCPGHEQRGGARKRGRGGRHEQSSQHMVVQAAVWRVAAVQSQRRKGGRGRVGTGIKTLNP